MTDAFDALVLPMVTAMPRARFTAELRARVHKRLDIAPPPGAERMRRAAGLEYEIVGPDDGEAVLLMHAGFMHDSYRPLLSEAALTDRYRLVRYHRRGYAGSDRYELPTDAHDQAADALSLLEHLGIDSAHVVGHSGSGVFALQLAIDAPNAVRSLVLEEPAVAAVEPAWFQAMTDLIAPVVGMFEEGQHREAMEAWMRGACGADWRTDAARTVPGAPQQALDNVVTTFEADVPAVQAWTLERADAERITQPVLYITGAQSDRFMHALARRFRSWVPQTEIVVIDGANHALHWMRPDLVAMEMSTFFSRQSI